SDLTGVISKRDVDKAKHHKLGHAPVRGFMSHPVITVGKNTSLSQMQRMMVKEDIGRLPVLDAEARLVGIVGRQELLEALYGYHAAEVEEPGLSPVLRIREVHSLLLQVDPEIVELYRELGTVAAAGGMTAHLVGGCVRDLILQRETTDLDFVVEGSAIQ